MIQTLGFYVGVAAGTILSWSMLMVAGFRRPDRQEPSAPPPEADFTITDRQWPDRRQEARCRQETIWN